MKMNENERGSFIPSEEDCEITTIKCSGYHRSQVLSGLQSRHNLYCNYSLEWANLKCLLKENFNWWSDESSDSLNIDEHKRHESVKGNDFSPLFATRQYILSVFKFLYHLIVLSKRNYFLLYSLILFPMVSISAAFCPKGCICDDNIDLTVRCIDGKMDVVPILLNPNTLNLDLSHNRIRTILPGFAFYHELKVLNVSYNQLVSLGEGNFMSQKNLSALIIRNNKISKLEDLAFEGLSSLAELDVSYNYIESIHSSSFRYISKLSKLDLSGNRISTLNPKVFQNLNNLKELNLCKNLLSSLSKEVFEPLKELKILLICSNDVTVLSDASFGFVESLTYLSLENNHISLISKQSLNGLQSLKQLNLRDNLLDRVPTEQINALQSLEDLNLSLNTFYDIGPRSLETVRSLRSLSVSHCSNLSSISDEAFLGLDSLVSLEMSFNPNLRDLNIEILQPLSQLRRLDLRSNGIESLQENLLSVGNLQYVDLRDNQFHCSCDLKWLQQASTNKTLGFIIEDVVCHSPENLKGRRISKATDYDLRCYGHLITIAICLASTALVLLIIAIAFVIYYKNCRKVKSIVHDNWPDKIVTTWRDSDYQKQIEDDEYTFHSLHGVHQIPVTVMRSNNHLAQSPMIYSNNTTLKLNIPEQATFTPKTRLMKSLTMSDTRQQNGTCKRKTFRTNSQIERTSCTSPLSASDIEGPYASISLANGFQRNHYESPQALGAHLYNPSTLYADPAQNKPRNIIRSSNSSGSHYKTPKDPGYYSCEFLVDQSSHSSPQSDSKSSIGTAGGVGGNVRENSSHNHYQESDLNTNSRNGFRTRLPPSDSGVFTLTRTYSRPIKGAEECIRSPSGSIYDNIL